MRDRRNRCETSHRPWSSRWVGGLALAALLVPSSAFAGGKVAWLDEVVQEVILEARSGGKALAEGEATATARAGGRLFAREADEGLEALARRTDSLARSAHRAESPAEAVLQTRFNRLVRSEPELARSFGNLAPAEKKVVVEMGEAAHDLARRFPAPGQAEDMVRKLGTEGLAAVRVYGDDVAEVVAKEGPESPGRPPQDGPDRLGLLYRYGPAAQEEAGRRRCPGLVPRQP